MSIPATVAVVPWPRASTAVPSTDWPAPSLDTVTGAVQVAIPEPASAQVNVTVTGVRLQPVALAAPVIVGAVVSTEIAETVAVAVWPTRSAAVPVTDWPAPSVATVTGAAQDAIPDP